MDRKVARQKERQKMLHIGHCGKNTKQGDKEEHDGVVVCAIKNFHENPLKSYPSQIETEMKQEGNFTEMWKKSGPRKHCINPKRNL